MVQLKVPSASSKFPLVRSALLCANLIAPPGKIVDGVPRLITKTDVLSLARKTVLLQVISAEEILSEAWSTLQECVTSAELPEGNRNAMFGRLSSRVILFMLKKEKDGIEGVSFQGFAAIKQSFHRELAATGISQDIAPVHAVTSASSSAVPAISQAPASLEEVSDPSWIAQQNGFTIGTMFNDKLYDGRLTRLVSFSQSGASFQEFTLSEKVHEPQEVHFSELATRFTKFTGKMPAKVTGETNLKYMASSHPVVKFEQLKVSAYVAMTEASLRYEGIEKQYVSFLINPFELRTKTAVPAKALQLFPVTELSKYVKASVTSSFFVESDSAKLYIEAPQRIKDVNEATWNPYVMFSGFWWVTWTSDKTAATVKLTQCKLGDWTCPMFENVKALPAWTKLVAYAEPKKKAVGPAEPSKKKAR